jgi:hypothetical protein
MVLANASFAALRYYFYGMNQLFFLRPCHKIVAPPFCAPPAQPLGAYLIILCSAIAPHHTIVETRSGIGYLQGMNKLFF